MTSSGVFLTHVPGDLRWLYVPKGFSDDVLTVAKLGIDSFQKEMMPHYMTTVPHATVRAFRPVRGQCLLIVGYVGEERYDSTDGRNLAQPLLRSPWRPCGPPI